MRFQTLSAIAFASAVSAQTYPVAPTYPAAQATPTSVPGGNQCASACTATFDKCKAQPGENNSFCVSQYAGCLGYNPFAAGAPSPTACVSIHTSVSTYIPAPSAGADTKCAAACTATFDKCKAQPGENNSLCVSQYAGCLGYNPFAAGAASPTACVNTPKPTTTPTAPAGGDKCATACTAAFDKCKAQPGENNSFCVSQYAGCLGYNPFAAGAPSPTACVNTAQPTYTPAPSAGADKCATACLASFDNCRAQPGRNNSFCVSQYAGCLGYNPYEAGAPSPTACINKTPQSSGLVGTGTPPAVTPTPSPVPFDGAAGSNKPVMGLLALGLLAML